MSRVDLAERYFIVAQHGHGFAHISDSTNHREVAFRLVAIRAKAASRKYAKNTVPTYYVVEKLGYQKAEVKPKVAKEKKKKPAPFNPTPIEHFIHGEGDDR